MKVYLVGGAIRDRLLGVSNDDTENDWLVVGSTVDEMISLGYKQVGKDFPVFLDPKEHEEFALARLEKSVRPGYKGFEFNVSSKVTLEEDLSRRDLTINAITQLDGEGPLIDPFKGQKDLEDGVLRHITEAFSDDPVRVLRVARFAARFSSFGFSVASETIKLMKSMVSSGDRSAKIRTYNYPQGRITEHRIGMTLYDLPKVINGDIQKIIDELMLAENSEILNASN